MLLGQEYIQRPDGLIVTRNHYNFDDVWQKNYELRKRESNGFSDGREMQHVLSIPAELVDVDPLVAQAAQGDEVCMRLAAAKYPGIKACNGNI